MDLSKVSEFPQLSYLSEARFIEIVKNTKKARIIWIDQKICEYFEENGWIPFKGITLVEENKTPSEEYSKNLLFDYSHLFCSNTQILTLALNRLEETAATEYFAKDKIVNQNFIFLGWNLSIADTIRALSKSEHNLF